jgi:type II secretory pathway pseudopilin PulG
MKKLSKEKRNQLIIVIIVTVAILGLIGFGLIRSQFGSLAKIKSDKAAADSQLQTIKKAITNADALTIELTEVTNTLSQAEEDMASGDLYSWTYDTIRRFKLPYKVEIPEIGHPTIGNVDLLPSFPYKQIQFSINGTAYYHDLGKFIADFENNFPHSRMVRLVIDSGGDNTEKLSFRMEILALMKPNSS